jgi:formylglycine-generating enzyme required for sulfatase activity
VDLNMVYVSPGQFLMGSPDPDAANRNPPEGPQELIEIQRGYWIGQFEVTQAQYRKVMWTILPSESTGDPLETPVDSVRWPEAVEFCERLTHWQRAHGGIDSNQSYRLPTEVEWEYACRADSESRYSFGEDPDAIMLNQYAWYGFGLWEDQSFARPIGEKKPNAWGLYDMHGNVAELCSDVFRNDRLFQAGYRIVRGGSFASSALECRSASREYRNTPLPWKADGFRFVLSED